MQSASVIKTDKIFAGTDVRRAPLFNALPQNLQALADRPQQGDGLIFLQNFPDACIPLVFFDPQYRGVMDKLAYGNEGSRQRARSNLHQMSDTVIKDFLASIARILIPSGHCMLWVDKFHLVEGITPWLADLPLQAVDLITWDKGRFGMGYRTRRQAEYLAVLQKTPKRAKDVWTVRNIPDVVREALGRNGHAHAKPEGLQLALIEAVTVPGDPVVDPAAGGFSVLRAAVAAGRRFLGTDLPPN